MPYQKMTPQERKLKKLKTERKNLLAKRERVDEKVRKLLSKKNMLNGELASQKELNAINERNQVQEQIRRIDKKILDLEYLIIFNKSEK